MYGSSVSPVTARACTRVHVHLDYRRSPEHWHERWRRGEVLEEWPYGYQHAADCFPMSYSVDHAESRGVALLRRALVRGLGFDLIHAWRNRQDLARADVVWTHTERDHLAVGLLIRLGILDQATKVVAQSVWLWDRWHQLSRWRRGLYYWLLKPLTVHTTHSRSNLLLARQVLGDAVTLVPYGTYQLNQLPAPARPTGRKRLRVVAPGNDRDRDWATLAAAAERDHDLMITILSTRRIPTRVTLPPNVVVRPARGAAELVEAYATADVVAVPLQDNQHASGITVALEGLNIGRPVVVTGTGGLRDYLGEAVHYVGPGDGAGLAAALRRAAELSTADQLSAARRGVALAGLTDADYANRHVLLTEAVVAGLPPSPAVSAFAPVQISPLY